MFVDPSLLHDDTVSEHVLEFRGHDMVGDERLELPDAATVGRKTAISPLRSRHRTGRTLTLSTRCPMFVGRSPFIAESRSER